MRYSYDMVKRRKDGRRRSTVFVRIGEEEGHGVGLGRMSVGFCRGYTNLLLILRNNMLLCSSHFDNRKLTCKLSINTDLLQSESRPIQPRRSRHNRPILLLQPLQHQACRVHGQVSCLSPIIAVHLDHHTTSAATAKLTPTPQKLARTMPAASSFSSDPIIKSGSNELTLAESVDPSQQ